MYATNQPHRSLDALAELWRRKSVMWGLSAVACIMDASSVGAQMFVARCGGSGLTALWRISETSEHLIAFPLTSIVMVLACFKGDWNRPLDLIAGSLARTVLMFVTMTLACAVGGAVKDVMGAGSSSFVYGLAMVGLSIPLMHAADRFTGRSIRQLRKWQESPSVRRAHGSQQ